MEKDKKFPAMSLIALEFRFVYEAGRESSIVQTLEERERFEFKVLSFL